MRHRQTRVQEQEASGNPSWWDEPGYSIPKAVEDYGKRLARAKKRPDHIERFEGTLIEELENFEYLFKQHMQENQIRPADWGTCLIGFLKGPALAQVRQLIAGNDHKDLPYQTLIENIRDAFGGDQHTSVLKSQFQALKWDGEEPCPQFLARLKTKVMVAYAGMSQMWPSLLKERFIMGMPYRFQQVVFNCPTDMSLDAQAAKVANWAHIQAANVKFKDEGGIKLKAVARNTRREPIQSTRPTAVAKPTSSVGKPPYDSKPKTMYGKGQCYECGSTEHFARDCPKKDNKQPRVRALEEEEGGEPSNADSANPEEETRGEYESGYDDAVGDLTDQANSEVAKALQTAMSQWGVPAEDISEWQEQYNKATNEAHPKSSEETEKLLYLAQENVCATATKKTEVRFARNTPKAPIMVNGVLVSQPALLDSGAAPAGLIPLSILAEVMVKTGKSPADLEIIPTTGMTVTQANGEPLELQGKVWLDLEVMGRKVRRPLLVCPKMGANDGILLGCHTLHRLGFQLLGPDGSNLLQDSDHADNMSWRNEVIKEVNEAIVAKAKVNVDSTGLMNENNPVRLLKAEEAQSKAAFQLDGGIVDYPGYTLVMTGQEGPKQTNQAEQAASLQDKGPATIEEKLSTPPRYQKSLQSLIGNQPVPKFKTIAPKLSTSGKIDAIFRILESNVNPEEGPSTSLGLDEDESEGEQPTKDGIRIKN